MGFFEGLSEKITTGATNISNSAKRMTSTAKINSEINSNTNKIDKLMKSIGVAVKARLMDSITDEEVLQLSEEIDALVARNSELNEQLKGLRGFSKCLNCGKDLTADALFCPFCGTKNEKPGSAEPEDTVIHSDDNIGSSEEIKTAPAHKICRECGFIEAPDAMFCSSCGARIED